MKSIRRIMAVVKKEVRQLLRDRLTFGMIVGIPVLQLLMFGYAINMDVRNLNAALVDLAGTSMSRQVVMDLAHTQIINIKYQVSDVAELERLLQQGKISVGIYIPPEFDRYLQDTRQLNNGQAKNTQSAMQLLIDGSDTVVQGAASQLAQIASRPPPSAYNYHPPPVEIRTFYNPERRSPVNTVPGLIGVILTMTMVLFTAVAIVRERERGNLELLITTPVRTSELMLAKITPYVVIGLIQVSLILLLGHYLFHVPLRGSLLDVYIVALVFIIANLALGLMISTIVSTQFQAMQLSFFILLPSILLSGFMFPFAGMPKLAQIIAEILPLTHFIRLIRGVVLRGASLQELGFELAVLGGFFVVFMTLAILRFSKRLD